MRAVILFALCCCLACSPVKQAAVETTGWPFEVKSPGPDLPPAGASLFDETVKGQVPFPFSALVSQIQNSLGPSVPLRRVLIPLGRSLQRSAAAPDFFEFPRAVAAFGDRLFLGYQEKAGILEVLSYNEQAGRFEFQLVQNYREGGDAQRVHAARATCVRCHQNRAPIFPRQLWDETNANAGTRRLLEARRREFYGFPLEITADVPYQIDQAIHRANLYSVVRRVWADSDSRTRAAWMAAARGGDGKAFSELLMPGWAKVWPQGLWIPNPEIEDRSPMALLSRTAYTDDSQRIGFLVALQKNIGPEFEPAVVRAPLEIWKAGDAEIPGRLIAASKSDIDHLPR